MNRIFYKYNNNLQCLIVTIEQNVQVIHVKLIDMISHLKNVLNFWFIIDVLESKELLMKTKKDQST